MISSFLLFINSVTVFLFLLNYNPTPYSCQYFILTC
nr:MAG TPA: hypothetical protein [Caudoviricetes sp.]DAX31497.1 MAG TPA: hypothetical protein [Caudoviricetes sp.]